jgi:hypothetical protein
LRGLRQHLHAAESDSAASSLIHFCPVVLAFMPPKRPGKHGRKHSERMKMKKQSRSITSLQLHNSALFLSTTHYFSGNSSDTQLSEVSIVQRLPSALRLPLKEIKKKSISYSSKERQVFASLIKSNSAVSVLVQPQFDPQPHQCCFYTEKKTLHWIATAFIMFI